MPRVRLQAFRFAEWEPTSQGRHQESYEDPQERRFCVRAKKSAHYAVLDPQQCIVSVSVLHSRMMAYVLAPVHAVARESPWFDKVCINQSQSKQQVREPGMQY